MKSVVAITQAWLQTTDRGGAMGLDGLQNQFILNIESSNENTETTESTQTPKQ